MIDKAEYNRRYKVYGTLIRWKREKGMRIFKQEVENEEMGR